MGGFNAKPLCVNNSICFLLPLCPEACKYLWEEEPTAEHPSACCPIPSIWASLLAQPCCQTEQQGMKDKQMEEDLVRPGLLFCGALAFPHCAVHAGHCWQGRTCSAPWSMSRLWCGAFYLYHSAQIMGGKRRDKVLKTQNYSPQNREPWLSNLFFAESGGCKKTQCTELIKNYMQALEHLDVSNIGCSSVHKYMAPVKMSSLVPGNHGSCWYLLI